MVNKK